MGYSYTAKAGYTLDAISALVRETTSYTASNAMPDGGFYETGRERPDGAITGTVYSPCGNDRVMARGSFRIDPDGRIRRFPGLGKALKARAEAKGNMSYLRNHGSWRERGAAMLEDLEANRLMPALSYSWFEFIHHEWMKENRIMFGVMPPATRDGVAGALRDMLAG